MRLGRAPVIISSFAAAIAGCGGAAPAVEVREIAAPPTNSPPPRGACDGLEKPLADLRELAALVGLGRSAPIQPLSAEKFAAALDADAAAARAVRDADPELSKLARDAEARSAAIATAARAFAAKRGGDREASRVALLEEMERGELLVQIGERRCGKGEGLAGTLPASAIARVVRGGFGEMKRCYEAGLRRDPGLRGTVRVRFTIARDGTVREAVDADGGAEDALSWGSAEGGAAIKDAAVRACVVAAFAKLVFPRPQGGTFTATYPVELTSAR